MNNIELLSIDLSNYCSKQCSFCYNHSNRRGNTLWTPMEVISFAKDCIANDIKAISLGGGEPFEYDGLFEVIDALEPIVYLSITSNGLPLEKEEIWSQLKAHTPDKVHITIHHPDDSIEVERVFSLIQKLKTIHIKPGINLLVAKSHLLECQNVYNNIVAILNPDQIILVPQRFSDTPSPQELASVSGGKPFQSPSCLLECKRPLNFVSVSWNKYVNSCSFAGGKEPLETLNYEGLVNALNKVQFASCY